MAHRADGHGVFGADRREAARGDARGWAHDAWRRRGSAEPRSRYELGVRPGRSSGRAYLRAAAAGARDAGTHECNRLGDVGTRRALGPDTDPVGVTACAGAGSGIGGGGGGDPYDAPRRWLWATTAQRFWR